MRIAIASGKGGTGKTTVAVNLSLTIRGSVRLLDCDVEEPNCHIFLHPEIFKTESVGIHIPQVDEEKCIACGECGRICQYHAIVSLKSKPLVFPELCHGCGGCSKVCSNEAITEVEREIGVVEEGCRGNLMFVHGCLNVGEAMAPPLIRAVKRHAGRSGLTIIDSPPGTSCPVIASVCDSDFVVLVTEPTPFGLNDLALAVEMIRQLAIPFGVVINCADVGNCSVMDYCSAQNIPVLLEIPDSRRVAEAYSRGEAAVEAVPELRERFEALYGRITEAAADITIRTKGESVHADL